MSVTFCSLLSVIVLAGGWPRLNSEKRLWVPHPCGFQGAVFVPHLTNRRELILITETTIDLQ